METEGQSIVAAACLKNFARWNTNWWFGWLIIFHELAQLPYPWTTWRILIGLMVKTYQHLVFVLSYFLINNRLKLETHTWKGVICLKWAKNALLSIDSKKLNQLNSKCVILFVMFGPIYSNIAKTYYVP